MYPTYGSSQKAIHWAVFLLVIGLYGLTYAEDLFPRGDPNRDLVWWFHISFGLLLFALVIIRIGLRLVFGAPELPSEMTLLERWLAKVAHLLLYALLMAIPVLGILLTWFRGDALSFSACSRSRHPSCLIVRLRGSSRNCTSFAPISLSPGCMQ